MRDFGGVVLALAFIFLTVSTVSAQPPRRSGSVSSQHYYLLSLAYSADGKYVAYGGTDSSVFIADARSGLKRRELVGHEGEVISVAFSPGGSLLASASMDGTVKLWAWESGELRRSLALEARGGAVFDIAFSPDGDKIASAASDSVVKVWGVQSGKLLFSTAAGMSHITSVAFSRGGEELVVGGWDGRDRGAVEIWRLSERLPKTRRTFSSHVTALAVIEHSGDVLVGDRVGSVSIYDLDKDVVKKSLKVHAGQIRDIEVSPDKKLFAAVMSWATPDVKVWTLNSPEKEIRAITNDLDGATALRFSPDGKEMAVVGRDNVIRFWDVLTGKQTRSITPQ